MPVDLATIRSRHARAVALTSDVVTNLKPADLDRATPCAEWTLAHLLSHMIVQHRGFAAAASGTPTVLDTWVPQPLSADPISEYTAAAAAVVAAYSDDAVADREIWLPELSEKRPFSATDALTFQFIDDVVHAWDVARSLDMPLHVDDDLADAALAVALAVPNDPDRRGPGFAFEAGRPAEPNAGPLDRALAALGRSPAWPA